MPCTNKQRCEVNTPVDVQPKHNKQLLLGVHVVPDHSSLAAHHICHYSYNL